MTAPLYPNVPNVPGVPSLLRLASASLPLPVLAVADGLGLQSFLTPIRWGIFQGGAPVITVDTVLEMGMERDFEISDFPIEQGGFASYNKIARPYNGRIRVAVGGNTTSLSAFFTTLDAIVADLNLYQIVTPEYVYSNANVKHYDYHRKRRSGVTLVQADIWLEEIRPVATAVYASTQSVNGAAQTSGGTAPIIPVTSQQLPPITAAGAT